jgi:hypothetical protein
MGDSLPRSLGGGKVGDDDFVMTAAASFDHTHVPHTPHPPHKQAPAWMRRQATRILTTLLLSHFIIQAAAFVFPPALPPTNLRPCCLGARLLPTAMASSIHNQADQQQVQEHVLATLHPNRVLELQLQRPKALNALSSPMLLELTKYVQRALANEKDDEGKEFIEAVLLTAVEGSRAFSAGGDIKEIMTKLLSEKTEVVTQGKRPQGKGKG